MMNLWKGTVRRVGATLLACVLLLGLLPQLPRQQAKQNGTMV